MGARAGAGDGVDAGATARGRSSSMAWEVGRPSSAVKEPLRPPPPPLPAEDRVEEPCTVAEGISAAWISAPAAVAPMRSTTAPRPSQRRRLLAGLPGLRHRAGEEVPARRVGSGNSLGAAPSGRGGACAMAARCRDGTP